MNRKDSYYIELAEVIHELVPSWDPYALIEGGAPEDEFTTIEMRFISGIINNLSHEEIIENVIRNWEEFGTRFSELEEVKRNHLKLQIENIIKKAKSESKFK